MTLSQGILQSRHISYLYFPKLWYLDSFIFNFLPCLTLTIYCEQLAAGFVLITEKCHLIRGTYCKAARFWGSLPVRTCDVPHGLPTTMEPYAVRSNRQRLIPIINRYIAPTRECRLQKKSDNVLQLLQASELVIGSYILIDNMLCNKSKKRHQACQNSPYVFKRRCDHLHVSLALHKSQA